MRINTNLHGEFLKRFVEIDFEKSHLRSEKLYLNKAFMYLFIVIFICGLYCGSKYLLCCVNIQNIDIGSSFVFLFMHLAHLHLSLETTLGIEVCFDFGHSFGKYQPIIIIAIIFPYCNFTPIRQLFYVHAWVGLCSQSHVHPLHTHIPTIMKLAFHTFVYELSFQSRKSL